MFKAEQQGELQVERITPERFRKAYALRIRYRDKPRISFTDLTSFIVMHELKIKHALTGDGHFKQSQLGFVTLP